MASGIISGIAAAVAGMTLPVPDTDGTDADYFVLRAGHDNAVPNSNHNVGLTGTGFRASNFFWDFYNRVYVTPKHIDYGALSSQAIRYIDVWSAWLVSINLTRVDQTDTEGLEFSGIAPKQFKALELATYSVTALLDGPPTIAASYQFEFTSGDSPMVTVSGSRAKVWPFAVDWSSPFRVNLSYKTEIWASRSGKEQRRALRDTPRKSLEFTSHTNHAKLRAFKALMATWQNKVMIMPEVTRSALITAPVADGSATVLVDALEDWLVDGATVVMVSGERLELRKIDLVNGLAVTFTSAGGAWPAGTKLHPGLEGMLAGELRVKQFTDSVARVSVQFDVTPASELPRALGSAVSTLGGREVFTKQPNWRDGIDLTYQYTSETVDYGRGRTATFRPIHFSTQIFKASYLGKNAARALELQQFFERQRGRQGEFYMPTGLNDLPLKVPSLSGNFYLRIADQEVFSAYAQDTVHRAVEVVMNDGRRLYRQVEEITAVSDSEGNDTLIKVTAAWPYTLNPAEVAHISWMPTCRHATDEMTIEWLTDSVAQTQFAIQTLEDLPPA